MNKQQNKPSESKTGEFELDDGGNYVGGWDGNMAVGYGVCTDPDGLGCFKGLWHNGFEVSGVKTWSRDNNYAGQWTQGRKHGLGVEQRGHWVYKGEWTQGAMGRYGVRMSTKSNARYEGTWTQGLQDGYGMETYADLGTYQGQWLRGSRHGFGVRTSAAYSKASFMQDHGKRRSSLTSTRSSYDPPSSNTPQNEMVVGSEKFHLDSDMMKATRIGHFLASAKYTMSFKRIQEENSDKKRSRSLTFELITGSLRTKLGKVDEKGNSIKFKKGIEPSRNLRTKEKSPFDFHNKGFHVDESEDGTTEIYAGDWKNDKRDGHGVCERSDGTKYEGQWVGNRRNGFGITYYPGNMQDAGLYKDDVLLSGRKKNALLNALTIAKTRKEQDKVMLAVMAARKAAQMANQKSDIANSRMESARQKAQLAEEMCRSSKKDANKAEALAEELRKNKKEEDQGGETRGEPQKPLKATRPDSLKVKGQHLALRINNKNMNSMNNVNNNPITMNRINNNTNMMMLNNNNNNNMMMNNNNNNNMMMMLNNNNNNNMMLNNNNNNNNNNMIMMMNMLNNNMNNNNNMLTNNMNNNIVVNKMMSSTRNMANNMGLLSNKDLNINAIMPDNINNKNNTMFNNNNNNVLMNNNIMLNNNNNMLSNKNLPPQNTLGNLPEDLTIGPINIAAFRSRDLGRDERMQAEEERVKMISKMEDMPLQRRLTLPTIVKCKDLALPQDFRVCGANQLPGNLPTGSAQERIAETKIIPEKVSEKNVLIRDGRREMVEAVENGEVVKGANYIDVEDGWFENKPRELTTVVKTYQIKAPRKYELGSTPNMNKVKISEVSPLGWAELREMNRVVKERMAVEMEMRKKKTIIVLPFGTFFSWVLRNFSVIFLIFINFFIFYHFSLLLLPQNH